MKRLASLLLAVLLGVFLLTSCGRRETELTTGLAVPAQSLPGLFQKGFWHGDATYAVVRYDALPALYDDFRSTLSNLGLVKWDEKFDCNRFSTLYIGVAQARYAVAAWHSRTPARALALAEVWYHVGGDPKNAHSIVQAYTDRGPVYVEPQSGRVVALTPAEEASVFLRKW